MTRTISRRAALSLALLAGTAAVAQPNGGSKPAGGGTTASKPSGGGYLHTPRQPTAAGWRARTDVP